MAVVKQFFFYFTLFQQIVNSFLSGYEDLGQAQALWRVKNPEEWKAHLKTPTVSLLVHNTFAHSSSVAQIQEPLQRPASESSVQKAPLASDNNNEKQSFR